jgi:hypothetical protein
MMICAPVVSPAPTNTNMKKMIPAFPAPPSSRAPNLPKKAVSTTVTKLVKTPPTIIGQAIFKIFEVEYSGVKPIF